MVDQAYGQLQARILGGQYEPGEHLNEVSIADEFGISRLPVREALQRLAYEGLVEQIPRRGSFIPRLDVRKASNVLDVIGSLLALGARKAAANASEEDLESMRSGLDAVQQAIEQDPSAGYPHQVFDLHAEVVKFASNPVLESVLEGLDNQVQLIRRHGPSKPSTSGAATAWEEHVAILDAIEQRDPRLAAQRSEHHLEMVKQRLLAEWSPPRSSEATEKEPEG